MAKKAKIPDPLSEIAENVVALLETHHTERQSNPEAMFLNWSQIVASLSGVNPEWVLASLSKSPAKGKVLVAIPDDLKSPVALVSDVNQLAADSTVLQRLVHHPTSGCSELNPVRPLAELVKVADKSLRQLIEAHWSNNAGKLPAGLSPVLKTLGKKIVVQIHDERFARPDAVMSQRLVAALESLKSGGDAKYPATMSEILIKAGIESDNSLLPAAMCLSPFSDAVVAVCGKSPDTWFAFQADSESAVNAEGFLKRVLVRLCTVETPEVKLSSVAGLLSKDLQAKFSEVWRTHADLQRRFPFVELQPAGSKSKPDLVLRDARFPRAEKILSELLVKTLESARSASGYPMSLTRLHELANPKAETAVFQKAIILEPFASRAVIALPGASDSPVALTDDVGRLAACPALLDAVLGLMTNADNQAIAIDRLGAFKSLEMTVRVQFADAVTKAMSEGRVPSGLGAVKLAGKWHLFRTRDVLLSERSPTAAVEEPKPKRRATSAARVQESTKPAEPAAELSEPFTSAVLPEVVPSVAADIAVVSLQQVSIEAPAPAPAPAEPKTGPQSAVELPITTKPASPVTTDRDLHQQHAVSTDSASSL